MLNVPDYSQPITATEGTSRNAAPLNRPGAVKPISGKNHYFVKFEAVLIYYQLFDIVLKLSQTDGMLATLTTATDELKHFKLLMATLATTNSQEKRARLIDSIEKLSSKRHVEPAYREMLSILKYFDAAVLEQARIAFGYYLTALIRSGTPAQQRLATTLNIYYYSERSTLHQMIANDLADDLIYAIEDVGYPATLQHEELTTLQFALMQSVPNKRIVHFLAQQPALALSFEPVVMKLADFATDEARKAYLNPLESLISEHLTEFTDAMVAGASLHYGNKIAAQCHRLITGASQQLSSPLYSFYHGIFNAKNKATNLVKLTNALPPVPKPLTTIPAGTGAVANTTITDSDTKTTLSSKFRGAFARMGVLTRTQTSASSSATTTANGASSTELAKVQSNAETATPSSKTATSPVTTLTSSKTATSSATTTSSLNERSSLTELFARTAATTTAASASNSLFGSSSQSSAFAGSSSSSSSGLSSQSASSSQAGSSSTGGRSLLDEFHIITSTTGNSATSSSAPQPTGQRIKPASTFAEALARIEAQPKSTTAQKK